MRFVYVAMALAISAFTVHAQSKDGVQHIRTKDVQHSRSDARGVIVIKEPGKAPAHGKPIGKRSKESNPGSELSMIQVQDHVAAKQRALQMTTDLRSKTNCPECVKNIGK